MKECKECDLAIYCYSDSSTWVFRTKEEMEEKRAAMLNCPSHEQIQKNCPAVGQECPEAEAV